jgi:hypothetical protein
LKRRRPLLLVAAATIVTLLVIASTFLSDGEVRRDLAFRLTADAGPLGAGELPEIAGAEPPELRLAVAGDVGTGEEDEQRTATAMDLTEGDGEYAALLLLGDNVYPYGDPALLQKNVYQPFAGVLDGDTRLLAVLGNHDADDGYGDAQAVAIGMPARWYATRIGDVLILSLDSNDPENPDQLTWLESTLADNDATWTIATLHHPPYSGGWHGSNLDVRDAFVPLFERYGVQLVLAGHDHDYQRSENIGGVTYVVTGGAAKLRPANRAEFTEVAASRYHFVDLAIWPDHLDLRAIDADGALMDAVRLRSG